MDGVSGLVGSGRQTTGTGRPNINTTPDKPKIIGKRWVSWLILAIAVVIIVLFVAAPPWTVLGKTDVVGYAVCHQIPARSFHVGGHQLPLCARCSGSFLGALTAFTVLTLLGRRKCAALPPVPILLVLILFIGVMAFDGLNSYMTFFPGMPHLYEPQNWLRLTTGMLNGLALGSIVYPVLSFTLWQDTMNQPALRNLKELALLLLSGAAVVILVLLELPPLLYPLAILSAVGVLVMLTSLNTMIVLAIAGREGQATHWREVVLPLTVGLALAIMEITAINLLRASLTQAAGLPF